MSELEIESSVASAANIKAAREIVEQKRDTPFFQRRYRRNVLNRPQEFHREAFWKQMVVCMCTSVQPSGPNSRLSRFVRENPFPLSLDRSERMADLTAEAGAILSSRGLRFGPKIAEQIIANLAVLQTGMWETVAEQFTRLARFPVGSLPEGRIAEERRAARSVMGRRGGLAGFGPKQARNLWQCLGVTLYEIPLDSRICGWLNGLPSPFQIEPSRLYVFRHRFSGQFSHCKSGGGSRRPRTVASH